MKRQAFIQSKILEAVRAGLPLRHAEKKYRVPRTTIRRWLAGEKVTLRTGLAASEHHYRRWTPADDMKLELRWAGHGLAWIAKSLGRSQATVYWRARQIGLPCGCPQGYEYLSAAAKRTGFSTGQLRAILEEAGVGVHKAISRPMKRTAAGRRSFHVVDPFDVDQAVALWGATEVVESAARARGIAGDTLRHWLVKSGHVPPSVRKARWRVQTEAIDRLVSKYRNVHPVAAHARRIGVARATLAGWLRQAGVLGEKRPGVTVSLAAEIVDGVAAGRRTRRAA